MSALGVEIEDPVGEQIAVAGADLPVVVVDLREGLDVRQVDPLDKGVHVLELVAEVAHPFGGRNGGEAAGVEGVRRRHPAAEDGAHLVGPAASLQRHHHVGDVVVEPRVGSEVDIPCRRPRRSLRALDEVHQRKR